MGAIKKVNPIGNVSKVLKGGLVKNMGKILKTGAGPIVKTVANLAEFGMIMASDDPKKKKAKGLVSAAGGTIGGILGGIAAGTLGAIGGPMSIVMGGLGAMAGDYLGRMIVETPAIQNMLAPWFEELFLGGSDAKKAPMKAAANPITPPPPAKKKKAAKPKLPSAKKTSPMAIASGMSAAKVPSAKKLDPPTDSDGNRLDHMTHNGMPVVSDGQWVNQESWKKIGFNPKLASMSPEDFMASFQTGGRVLQGGTALVGEKGPELVSLPRGAYVTPNDAFAKAGAPAPQAQAQSGAATTPVAVNVSINVDDRRLKEVFSTTVEQVITGV